VTWLIFAWWIDAPIVSRVQQRVQRRKRELPWALSVWSQSRSRPKPPPNAPVWEKRQCQGSVAGAELGAGGSSAPRAVGRAPSLRRPDPPAGLGPFQQLPPGWRRGGVC